MELVLNGKKFELDEEEEDTFKQKFEENFGGETRLSNISDSKKEGLLDEMGVEPRGDDKVGH